MSHVTKPQKGPCRRVEFRGLALGPSFTFSPPTMPPPSWQSSPFSRLYLPPCAPSHPIEIVEGPCLGEGVMITASQAPGQAHTIDLYTIKIG